MRGLDLKGKKFGKWAVLERAENNHLGESMWKCVCDCGTKKNIRGKDLKNGKSASCGCGRKGTRTIDLKGQKFGQLSVIERAGKYRGSVLWKCRCDCGEETVVRGYQLRNGRSTSCGKHNKNRLTHGMKGTRLYRIWCSMRARCNYPTASGYHNYGGRGISVCDEWDGSFETFRDWALENGYSDELSIDRIDNEGNYEPSNCRWATASQQQMNKRISKKEGQS